MTEIIFKKKTPNDSFPRFETFKTVFLEDLVRNKPSEEKAESKAKYESPTRSPPFDYSHSKGG